MRAPLNQGNLVLHFLLRCRIQHYFRLMKSFLMQYKQGLILLFALLVPTISGLNYFFTKPFLIFITADYPVNALISSYAIYCIYAMWIMIQKPAIQSQAAQFYCATLPVSKNTHQIVNVLMLLIANNLFLIPLIAVIAKISFLHYFHLPYFLSLLFLTVSIFAIQKNILCKNYFFCFLIFIVDFIYCFARPVLSDAFFSVISIFLIVFIFYMVLSDRKFLKSKRVSLFAMKRYPLSLRSALLLCTAKTETILRLCLTVFIFIMGLMLSFFSKLSLYPVVMMMVVQGMAAFMMSGLFVYFEKEKRKYLPYLNTFPISKLRWMWRDIAYVATILTIFNIIFSSLIVRHFSIDFLWGFVALLYQIILLTMLYLIRTRFDVFGTVLSSVASVVWIYGAILFKGIV